MKKIICWLMAMAGLAAFAESFQVPTYHALSWKVPAASIAAVDAKYVNLYAEVGGVRVGSEARAVFGNADVDFTASTILQGDGGWNWTNPEDIYDATFAVEFLNAELGVIATSTAFAYIDILQKDVFDIVKTDNYSPSTALEPYTFSGFTVADDGVYLYLCDLLNPLGATVVPRTDASGNIAEYYVSLGNDITGPLVLAEDIGKITIDLKGHQIAGTNAWNGAEGAGGNAIEIAGQRNPDPALGPTALTLLSDPATGYAGAVRGGQGADSGTGTAGGYAVTVSNALAGVTVYVGENATVQGGASGNSMTNSATAGSPALFNATLATGSATAPDGAAGTAIKAWAWAKCTFSGELPSGTTQVGDTLWFWKRTAGATVSESRASFDFGALYGQTVADRQVVFVDETILVDELAVPAAAGDLVFVGQDNTVLGVDPKKSVFAVTSSADQTRVWTNLVFQGIIRTEWDGDFCSDGAAINVAGGVMKIHACAFAGCTAGQYGGAVCAYLLAPGSEIVGSTFTDNAGLDFTSYGGALYATAAAADTTLVLKDCTFEGNEAGNGGAISTEALYAAGEHPIGLDIAGCRFADNAADSTGGAIDAEGDLLVEAAATYDAPGTTLFTNNVASVAGGAIEINSAATDPAGVDITLGRGVVFVDNVASNDAEYVSGGAIDVYIDGTTLAAEGVAFIRNRVYGNGDGGDDWNKGAWGGAVCAANGTNTFDTCVFDGNQAVPVVWDYCYYGGAIEFESCVSQLRNCTFRNQNIEAVDVLNGTLAITNCVLVGNSLAASGDLAGIDLNVEGATVDTAYSAWGKAVGTLASEVCNQTNRTVAIYESADSLHLATNSFNAVASLGLSQPGIYDFDAVEYGSLPTGSAMGAFEAYAPPVTLAIAGTKTYDGQASSNGCTWTYTCTETDPDFTALGALEDLVTITDWTHGAKDAGDYAAPDTLSVTVDGNTDEIRRWIEMGTLVFSYTGTIERRPIAEGGLEIVLTPDEYPWTGSPVVPTLVVTDTLGGETLLADADHALSYADNVNPTASAVATVDTLRNYIGATNLTYAITAYYIEYTYDDVVQESLTKTLGETSGVAVAVAPADIPTAPVGYAFDYQHSYTNDTVRRADATDGLVYLQVRYCTDANLDGVPDKYQRQILAKIANGAWTSGLARDQVLWATLTNAATGKWDANGTGSLTGDAGTAGVVPAAGTNPRNGYKTGGWLAIESGGLVEVSDPATYVFKAGQVPFLIYAYLHDVGGTSGSGRGSGRGGKGTGSGTTVTQKTLLEQYSAMLKVKDATFTSDTLKLKTQLFLRDEIDNTTLTDVPVAGSVLTLYVTEKLGPEATWTSQPGVTDDAGVITVDLTGKSGFYKVGL